MLALKLRLGSQRAYGPWLRKQTEARHTMAMETAEEKFRKAFERVKRVAIEAGRELGKV